MNKANRAIILLAASLTSAATAHAAVIMFDFGPTTTTTGTNSPLHTVDTEFTDSTWNKIGLADSSSLFYSDGSAATGITFDLGIGKNDGAGKVIDVDTQPAFNNALGGINSGVYAGTSVGKDGIYGTTSSNPFVGAQITGLAAGSYDVYISARNTNTGAHTINTYAGATASGDFDFLGSGFATDELAYASASSATSVWGDSDNYSKFTITLSEGEALSLATAGAGGGSLERGFLNSIQIVSVVPEPSSYALLGGCLAISWVMVRRRR